MSSRRRYRTVASPGTPASVTTAWETNARRQARAHYARLHHSLDVRPSLARRLVHLLLRKQA